MPDTDRRPAGLVPGQIVTLRALVRATSQGECYVEVMARVRRAQHQFWIEQGDVVAVEADSHLRT